MLPIALHSEVEAALTNYIGRTVKLVDARPVGGGCISNATRLGVTGGEIAFLKWCRQGELPVTIFQTEAHALHVLREAGAVRVPAVISLSDDASKFGWLLLEWLEPARLTQAGWRQLGQALAELHRCKTNEFGWDEPNFIGSLPQSNSQSSDWPSFWRTQRLLPQLERATRGGAISGSDRRRFDQLLNTLGELIAAGNTEGPSLLHGDLWNGNVHGVAQDGAALIDPASYYGHREVDLAMAELFGGFDAAFYSAYEEAWPQEAGSERRRLIYQLYYLLVHVNLFGGSYVGGTLSAVRKLGF
jgi:fructosamine-3-kinase